MKKLLLFFIVLLAFAFLAGSDLHVLAPSFEGDYVAYVTEGDGTPVFSADGKSAYAAEYGEDEDIIAETITVNGEFDEREVLRKLASIYHFHSDVDGVKIIYGFSPRLKRIRLIGGKPVNFQITASGNIYTVSSPVNIGSY